MKNEEEGQEPIDEQVDENANVESQRLAELEAENAKLQELLNNTASEAKRNRQAKAEEKRKAQEAMEKNGEYRALAETLQENLKEMKAEREQLLTKAQQFDRDAEVRQANLNKQLEKLAEEDRLIVQAGSSLAAQEMIAQRLLGSQVTKPKTQLNQDVATGSNSSVKSVTKAHTMDDLIYLLENDPEAYREAMNEIRKPKETSMIDILRKK